MVSRTSCSSYIFLSEISFLLSCAQLWATGVSPWGILLPWVAIRVLFAAALCSCLGFGHWQVIFPTVFLLLVWILIFFSPDSTLQSVERQPVCRCSGQKPLPLSKPKKMWIPWKTHHKRHRAPLCTLLSSPWQAVVPNFGEGGLAGHFPLLSLEETVLLLLLLPGPRVDACVSLNSALTKSSTRMSTNELFTSFTKNGSPKRNVNLKGVTVFTAVEGQHPTATTRNKAVT